MKLPASQAMDDKLQITNDKLLGSKSGNTWFTPMKIDLGMASVLFVLLIVWIVFLGGNSNGVIRSVEQTILPAK